MNPRPDIQEELIKPYKEMEDVYSLSCVVGDAMEREQVMRHDMKPKSINKKIIGPAITVKPVSYTHLTLPTNSRV